MAQNQVTCGMMYPRWFLPCHRIWQCHPEELRHVFSVTMNALWQGSPTSEPQPIWNRATEAGKHACAGPFARLHTNHANGAVCTCRFPHCSYGTIPSPCPPASRQSRKDWSPLLQRFGWPQTCRPFKGPWRRLGLLVKPSMYIIIQIGRFSQEVWF